MNYKFIPTDLFRGRPLINENKVYHHLYTIYIVNVIESAAYGVICTSCLYQKPERARYERVRAFDKNNECMHITPYKALSMT